MTNNSFIDKVNDGTKINICLIAHNTEWYPFDVIGDNENNNVSADIFNRGDYSFSPKDYDLVISVDDEIYDEDCLKDIEAMVVKISETYNKKVTFAYQSFIPFEERKDLDASTILVVESTDEEGKLVFKTEYKYKRGLSALNIASVSAEHHYVSKLVLK